MGPLERMDLRQVFQRPGQQPVDVALRHSGRPAEPEPRQVRIAHPPFRQGGHVRTQERRIFVRRQGFRQPPDLPHDCGQAGAHSGKRAGAVVVVRDARHDRRQDVRLHARERFGADQFGDQQRMVHANQPGPFSVRRQLAGGREVAELLEDIRAGLETVPQAGAQRMDHFLVALDVLPKFQGRRMVLLAGRSRRAGRAWKLVGQRERDFPFLRFRLHEDGQHGQTDG